MVDGGGNEITDTDLNTDPVIQVLFTSYGEITAEDVSDEVLPAGHGTDGNEFEFTDDGIWQFNLKSKNYSASGEYVVTVVSGDDSEYLIDPTCISSFVVQ